MELELAYLGIGLNQQLKIQSLPAHRTHDQHELSNLPHLYDQGGENEILPSRIQNPDLLK